MSTKLEVTMIAATVYSEEIREGDALPARTVFGARMVELRLPFACTVEQAIEALRAFEIRHGDSK